MAGRLEICVDSFESAANAVNGGANQLEVCSALSLGGLTPSIGLVRRIRAAFPDMPLFVMLRPRCGDFIYSDDEFCVMQEDLRSMKQIGVAGFVFGIIGSDGALDTVRCKRLIQSALPAPCTLHRTFDLIEDWKKAVKEAISLGFKTILTSGQAPTAMDGLTRLKKIRQEADNKINILVGSGVNSKTLPTLLSDTGCSWFHGSASVPVEPKAVRNGLTMGTHDTNMQRVTDKEEVSRMREQLDAFFGSRPIVTPYY
ncbi:putative copper homeostasis protein CutC [Necator americanus]|uniref:Copper homeostasis protein cutC homolog n=1 Tax=Necator americanus TaxID=51031 RepID=W2STK3_NECAM|nr:putative copper homeostasis protein CutC [Necator americanus]ETN72813.1 putative copper homeostasis protein CutC [Necator americanus]